MNLLAFVFLIASWVSASHAEKLDPNEVQPFPETNASSVEHTLALKFKPQLHIRSGCHPYPAVDADGNTNEGYKLLSSESCDGSPLGSQVYGRVATFKGKGAIMYAWYFPRERVPNPVFWGGRHEWEFAVVWLDSLEEDAELLSVTVTTAIPLVKRYKSYTPPDSDVMDGSSIKIEYLVHVSVRHYLKATTKAGEFQDLVMWDDMPEEARVALNSVKFGSYWVLEFAKLQPSNFGEWCDVEVALDRRWNRRAEPRDHDD